MKVLFLSISIFIFTCCSIRTNNDTLSLLVRVLNIHTGGYDGVRRLNSIYDGIADDTFYVIGTNMMDTLIKVKAKCFYIISDSALKHFQGNHKLNFLELKYKFDTANPVCFTINISDFHGQISTGTLPQLQYFNTSFYSFTRKKGRYVLSDYKEYSL
jgi:hypothetical protein